MLDSDDELFWIAKPLRFIAPEPIPDTMELICKVLVRADDAGRDGKPAGQYVPVFTDRHLADRYIDKFIEHYGERGRRLKPVSFPKIGQLSSFLSVLQQPGEMQLGFDPEATHVRIISIER